MKTTIPMTATSIEDAATELDPGYQSVSTRWQCDPEATNETSTRVLVVRTGLRAGHIYKYE